MFTYEKSIFIDRPQQEVFDFLSNPANDPQWRSSVESAEWISEGPPGVGSTQRVVSSFLGRKLDATGEVTIWDPPLQIGLIVVSGPIPWESTMTLEPKENGTQLTVYGQGELGGFFKMAEGLVGKQAKKAADTEFDALKHLLEAGQA